MLWKMWICQQQVWHIAAWTWKRTEEFNCISTVLRCVRFIFTSLWAVGVSLPTGTHWMTPLRHPGSSMTAGLGWVGEKGKWFWWMTFRVRPLDIANRLLVPKGLMAPICRSGRKEWIALCGNKCSLSVWNSPTNPSSGAKSIHELYQWCGGEFLVQVS